MRRSIAGFWWSLTAEGVPALVVTAAFFTLGASAGCLLAFQAAGSASAALGSYLDAFLASAREGVLVSPDFFSLLFKTLRWPLAAFLLGFSALGIFGIPVLSALRGFFLSFSVASFARAYGYSGLAVAFLLQGIPAAAAIPAFFLLCVQGFSSAFVLAGRNSCQGRREIPYHRAYFFRCGVCAAALAFGLLMERCLVPPLLTAWAGVLIE